MPNTFARGLPNNFIAIQALDFTTMHRSNCIIRKSYEWSIYDVYFKYRYLLYE